MIPPPLIEQKLSYTWFFIAILHAHLQNDTRGITVLLLLCVDDMVNKQAKCYKFLVLSRLTQLGLTAL